MPFIKESQERLSEELYSKGVSSEDISKLLASGYFYSEASGYGMGKPVPCVSDSLYGSKWFCGLMPIDSFIEQKFLKLKFPVYEVSSLHQIRKILNTDRHSRFFHDGRLSFRGQTKEYFTKRSYPNPSLSVNGLERLVIPSFWRRFCDNWMQRFDANPTASIFTTSFADYLVYYGIPEWKNLAEKNFERYGLHTMSDLVDFPDPESQEYGRRWRLFKVEGGYHRDLPLVEQHYGIDTCGLDVTFDIAVAAFFASHQFKWRANGNAYYDIVPDGDNQGVIYGFVFTDPPLRKTVEMVNKLDLFNHIPPIRPIRQKCALPFFHDTTMNEAVCDLDFIMRLSPKFDCSDIPSGSQLFPGEDGDPFYKATLEVKNAANGADPYNNFIEYQLRC